VKDPVLLEMKERAPQAVIEGRQLVAEKNCKGCHIVENLGGDLRAYLGTAREVNWPPSLNTQGMKTQPEWLRTFLKDPGANRPRPWLDTRMPTFHFTEHEINVIGEYFSTLDNVDWGWIDPGVESTTERLQAGEKLFTDLQCMKCHPTGPTSGDDANLAPNLQLAHNRLRPEWIRRWLLDPGVIAPNTRMPTFFAVDSTTGQRRTQVPNALNGDIDAQIQAIRDHLWTLGGGRVTVR
jgi:mono/diheme cytochrome c family protein